MSVFVTGGSAPVPTPNPEALFRDLPRTAAGPKHLWAHQADILRDYLHLKDEGDLAIELPTGAGKTLVGMLVGEWRRRELSERVVYLCPTLQLARQAIADAHNTGIRVVDLTGSHHAWNRNDHLAYVSKDAIAVAHYNAVFNSNPHLDDADLLIFDDAHAAAGAIADNWTVRFPHGSASYRGLATLLAEGLPGNSAERILAGSPDPKTRADGYLVDPAIVTANLGQVIALIGSEAQLSDAKYAWRLICDNVDACCIFFSADEVIIRPLLPPTSTHSAFTGPKQRLYLSATLGAGGELERAFGRRHIVRMSVPEGWDERGTGRRFFIFPELVEDFSTGESAGADGLAFVSNLMKEAGRSLLLTPSYASLAQAQSVLNPSGFANLSASDVEMSLSPFTTQPNAVLGLANRYDGIDLPDEDCRLIVMAGLPVGADPQEKFYTTMLGAKRVLQERTRTRFAQGAGRATRNANDRAVVVVLGSSLIAFAGDRDVQEGTHPEIRAELEVGLRNSSRRAAVDVELAIKKFLDQDSDWVNNVEPTIRALRERYAATDDAPDTKALAAAAPYEIQALEAAWRGQFGDAVTAAERAIATLAGGSELRPYQALWNYLASHWARLASASDASYAAQADSFTRAANAAAARTAWIPNRQLVGPTSDPETSRLDQVAVRGAISHAATFTKARALTREIGEMVVNLRQRDAAKYELGLVTLGDLLGAKSHKPEGEARADALWRWSDELWVAWEAKSEALAEKDISADDIRQANTHLRSAASDMDEEVPPGSHIFLVSAKTTVHASARALAGDELSFASLDQVRDIAETVAATWTSLQGRLLSGASDADLEASVLGSFTEAGILPISVIQALTEKLF